MNIFNLWQIHERICSSRYEFQRKKQVKNLYFHVNSLEMKLIAQYRRLKQDNNHRRSQNARTTSKTLFKLEGGRSASSNNFPWYYKYNTISLLTPSPFQLK